MAATPRPYTSCKFTSLIGRCSCPDRLIVAPSGSDGLVYHCIEVAKHFTRPAYGVPPNAICAGANLRQIILGSHMSKIDHFFVGGTVNSHDYHMIVDAADWLGVFVAGLD